MKKLEKPKAPLTEQSILSMIGLSMRQGSVESGSFCAERAIKTGKARLVLLATDASENTKKDFRDMCQFYHVPLCLFCEGDRLGHAIGKEFRVILALTNEGFANKIREMIASIQMDGIEK